MQLEIKRLEVDLNTEKESRTVQKMVDGESLNDTRASPKSQIFSLLSALARIFFGFRSRWKTLAANEQQEIWAKITQLHSDQLHRWANAREIDLNGYILTLWGADTEKIGDVPGWDRHLPR